MSDYLFNLPPSEPPLLAKVEVARRELDQLIADHDSSEEENPALVGRKCMNNTRDLIPTHGSVPCSAPVRFGCIKGILGEYFMATVNDNITCTHMHKTTRAAIRCARQWQAFQERVTRMRQTAIRITAAEKLPSAEAGGE